MAKQTIKQTQVELREIQRNLETLASAWQKVMAATAFAGKTINQLRMIPGRPRYPIRWTSERQRKAFFASNGFGAGIPTRRTGKIAGAWDAVFIATQDGGILAITNPHPEAKFVQGPQPFGQGFHVDTGWKQIDDVEETFYTESIGAATAVFFDEVNPFDV